MGAAMLLCAIVLFFPYCGFYRVLWEQRTLALILFLVGAYEYGALYPEKNGFAGPSPAER